MSKDNFIHKLDLSAILTIIGIFLLFAIAAIIILFLPYFTEKSWLQPTTPYQVQMYEVADPNFFISSISQGQIQERQMVHYLKRNYTLLAFKEDEYLKIITSPELEKFITRSGETPLKLTSELLLLRVPESNEQASQLRQRLQQEWIEKHPTAEQEGLNKPAFEILELFDPKSDIAFARSTTDGILENWVDKDFVILNEAHETYHSDPGVIYIANPMEYRISKYKMGDKEIWHYDPKGEPITSLEQLTDHPLHFVSRQELIKFGEHIYAIEGCWYCHTDQTRTLIQDVVLNGTESFPAPPSSPNEYIYQEISFPGTRRIGPDLSRVGIKRASRDWHLSHFWSPKTSSPGSIMPSFRHFFDTNPSGTGTLQRGIPNYRFEAIFQYLMTKGTRITPPTEAWWLGKDPVQTLQIIEGKRKPI